LGAEQVGVEDNFFELGGDSIITIQVVSQARRLGYNLQVSDVFTYQTISAIYENVIERQEVKTGEIIEAGKQEPLQGLIELLPIQQWFFENESDDISYFNQSVLLKIDKVVTIDQLEQLKDHFVEQHDVLHLRYRKTNGKWHQEYGEPNITIAQENTDAASSHSLAEQIVAIANRYH